MPLLCGRMLLQRARLLARIRAFELFPSFKPRADFWAAATPRRHYPLQTRLAPMVSRPSVLQRAPSRGATPTSIVAGLDDRALVLALRAGHPAAKAELFDRHAQAVERILLRILGSDAELGDLLHEVFVRALEFIHTLEDPDALKSWLTGIAVITARECLRRRARGRWLRFLAPSDLPEPAASSPSPEVVQALRATYAVLDRLGTDDRIAFALRFIEGLELADVARACKVSLNTIKRRLARAEQRFLAIAKREPALEDWLADSARWGRP